MRVDFNAVVEWSMIALWIVLMVALIINSGVVKGIINIGKNPNTENVKPDGITTAVKTEIPVMSVKCVKGGAGFCDEYVVYRIIEP